MPKRDWRVVVIVAAIVLVPAVWAGAALSARTETQPAPSALETV